MYIYMKSLRELNHPPSLQPTPDINWPTCPTPVRIPVLAQYLSGHPDQEFVRFVLHGLSSGFHVGFQANGMTLRSVKRNHPSSLANHQVVENYIVGEVAAGRMIGPVVGPLRDLVHCSPIGLVPKGRSSGQWRMIVDLSSPSGGSVNDGVAAPLCSLCYSSLDDAIKIIGKLGPGTSLIKVDLKSAYRMVPIHPKDRHLFGICWDDRVLCGPGATVRPSVSTEAVFSSG